MAYALGFLSCDDISARCMLSIFQFFATKTDASRLRMLNGSPAERLLAPIADYITSKSAPCPLSSSPCCVCLPEVQLPSSVGASVVSVQQRWSSCLIPVSQAIFERFP